MMTPCILVPFYNHERTLRETVERLRKFRLPCLIVDDGSSPSCAVLLAAVEAEESTWLRVLRHKTNQGKGAAVVSGLEAAEAAGYTHALQIDADLQHDIRDLPALLAAAGREPAALVIGTAAFDSSVPSVRRWARHLTHFWVRVHTLSSDIRDSMCGFRVYPVGATLAVCRAARVGRRMDFDIEIAVRMQWSGAPVVGIPTSVTYPIDGTSHFRVVRDNVLISAMHTRLFFGMLRRLPQLIARRAAGSRAGAAT